MPGRLQLLARHLLAQLRSALPNLPSSCALCGIRADAALCGDCEQQFFHARPVRCCQCALPLATDFGLDTRCGACLHQPPAFDATFVAADYVAPVDQLVLALKFGAQLALAPLFARLLSEVILQDRRHSLPTRLAAVPLGPQRLAARGFNQALEIARPLACSLGITLSARLVLRARETDAQALLHPLQRQRNMRDAFRLDAGADVRGQHVGIVDDVITTGATLNAMAALLKLHGAARVTNLVFARTLPK